MKCLEDIEKIINSYKLDKIEIPEGYKNVYELIKDFPEIREKYSSEKNDRYFIKKYQDYIVHRYYGFSIGTPVNPEWNECMDEILEYLVKIDPNFKIRQIKVKFGYMALYVMSDVIEDIHDIEVLIMNKLNDKALIF